MKHPCCLIAPLQVDDPVPFFYREGWAPKDAPALLFASRPAILFAHV